MRAVPHRHLSYASLVLLFAADLLALASLLLNQWLEIGPGWSWLLGAALTAAALPGLLWVADRVFAAAGAAANIPTAGGTFP